MWKFLRLRLISLFERLLFCIWWMMILVWFRLLCFSCICWSLLMLWVLSVWLLRRISGSFGWRVLKLLLCLVIVVWWMDWWCFGEIFCLWWRIRRIVWFVIWLWCRIRVCWIRSVGCVIIIFIGIVCISGFIIVGRIFVCCVGIWLIIWGWIFWRGRGGGKCGCWGMVEVFCGSGFVKWM